MKIPQEFSKELNSDVKIIKKWAFQSKMTFSPHPLKQATEVCFSKKSHVIDDRDLVFSNNIFHKASLEKHLGLILFSV